MKTDRLYSSFFFSLGLHSLFAVAAVLYMLYAATHYQTATFVVSLVDSSSGSPSPAAAQKTAEVQPAPETKNTHMTEKSEKVTTKEKTEVNERIAALEAKRKIEAMQRLRRTVAISKGTPGTKIATSGTGSGGSDYISLIGNKIHQQWIFPDTSDKDLLAIINIRIAKNGNVTILGFEKKSGNVLFDRAAIRAINNASPLPPPAAEMEIGLKFYP